MGKCNCLIFLLTFNFFILGCGPASTIRSLPLVEREQITTRIFSYDYDKVFDAVMNVFMDSGYPIKEADKDIGLITTDYKYILGHRRKMNAKITKINDNSCKVKLTPLFDLDLDFGETEKKNWCAIDPNMGHKEVFEKFFYLVQEQLD